MATNLKSLERRSEIIGSNWVAYVARKRDCPHVQGIKVKLFQDLTGGALVLQAGSSAYPLDGIRQAMIHSPFIVNCMNKERGHDHIKKPH